jgi:hypothetical protein
MMTITEFLYIVYRLLLPAACIISGRAVAYLKDKGMR